MTTVRPGRRRAAARAETTVDVPCPDCRGIVRPAPVAGDPEGRSRCEYCGHVWNELPVTGVTGVTGFAGVAQSAGGTSPFRARSRAAARPGRPESEPGPRLRRLLERQRRRRARRRLAYARASVALLVAVLGVVLAAAL